MRGEKEKKERSGRTKEKRERRTDWGGRHHCTALGLFSFQTGRGRPVEGRKENSMREKIKLNQTKTKENQDQNGPEQLYHHEKQEQPNETTQKNEGKNLPIPNCL